MAENQIPSLPIVFTRLMDDFQRSFHDFERLHAISRRRMIALAELHQLSFETLQDFARHQTRIIERTTETFVGAAGEILGARSPAEALERQTTIAAEAFQASRLELEALIRMMVERQEQARRLYRGGAPSADLDLPAGGRVSAPGPGGQQAAD